MSSNPSSDAESYKLQIKESAAKELESLGTKKDREKIVTRINTLASDPRPSGSEKLGGEENKGILHLPATSIASRQWKSERAR